MTTADVEALLAARLGEVRPASVARELSSLRALCRILLERGELAVDPTAGLRVQIGAQRQLLLSLDQVRLLLAEASRPPRVRRSPELQRALGLRNRAALELLYALGVRASEACDLRLLDLDLAQRSLGVQRVKRGPAGVLPLPEAVVSHLERYLAQARPALLRRRDEAGGALLVNERGRRLTPNHLLRLVRGIASRVEVDAYTHAFRRAVATHLVANGAALPAVQSLLGHKSLDTTQRYVAVSPDELRAAVETLEPRAPSA